MVKEMMALIGMEKQIMMDQLTLTVFISIPLNTNLTAQNPKELYMEVSH
jgi:hypothetical protein